MIIGVMVRAQLDALKINQLEGGFVGYGKQHAWTQTSVLWRFPYMDDLLLPHNIDVMHTKNNLGEALWGTIMDIPDKIKDNVKAGVDQTILCNRPKLDMAPPRGGES